LSEFKDDIARVTLSLKDAKTAFTELIQMATASKKRFAKAFNNLGKDENKGSTPNVKKARKQAAEDAKKKDEVFPVAEPLNPVRLGTCSELMPTEQYELDDEFNMPILDGGINPAAPALFMAKAALLTSKCPELIVQADLIAKKFAKVPEKLALKTRDHRKLAEKPLLEARAVLNFITSPDSVPPPEDERFQQPLTPSCFCVVEGHAAVMYEPFYLATARLHLKGTKNVIAGKTVDIGAFLASKATEDKTISLKAVHDFLENLDADLLKEYNAFGKSRGHMIAPVFFATVAPSSIFYLPTGWSYLEVIGKSANVVGVKVEMISAKINPSLQDNNN
jgi:hypothetical protein